jgi:hypothetical protein
VRAGGPAQAIPNQTDTALVLDTERFDTANMHDNAAPNNTKLVAPVTGIYNISASVIFTATPPAGGTCTSGSTATTSSRGARRPAPRG